MVTRVGGHKQIKTDVRLITATNRDLRQMIQEKTFREDLYFSLNVLSFVIPPLRERTEAIEAFVYTFLAKYNKKYKKNVTISDRTMKKLKAYRWSGNVRELKNVIERMVLTSDEDFMQMEFTDQAKKDHNPQEKTISELYKEEQQKKVISVLLSVNGNKSKAAQILGISRGKLYKMLKE